jgi:hypothetical protein
LLLRERMPNSHTKEQQAFIVRKLAAFKPPRMIVLDFQAVYSDTKCDENDVRLLDPSNGRLDPELKALFLAERERVLLDPNAATYSQQMARLIALSNHAEHYGSNNELPQMRAVLRQIAEETGIVGGKGKPGGKSEDEKHEPVGKIIREFVEPKPAKDESSEQQQSESEPTKV